MKKISILLFLTLMCLCKTKAQSILPSINDEYCPFTNYTFSVSGVPGTVNSVTPFLSSCVVVNIVSFGNGFVNFVGRFDDNNSKQTFRINYTEASGAVKTYDAVFKKIKSLLFSTSNSGTVITPNLSSINSPICQITNHSISFNNIQFYTEFEIPSLPLFGSIATYEYLLPVGWQLNGSTSTGVWQAGSNSVTITSNLSGGDGGSLQIRAVNPCFPSLVKGAIKSIPINRNAPTYSLSPSNLQITCGNLTPVTFTVNQSGASIGAVSYSWNLGANNGWSYLGAPAPASIVTSSNNSIVLTPVCGQTQNNVSASVTTNCLNVNTNVCGVTNVQANPIINGPNSVCSPFIPTTFSVSNIPCDAIVNWNASQSGIINLSTLNGPTTNATYSSTGTVTLTANILSASCGNFVRTFQILSGGRQVNTGVYTQPNGYATPRPFGTWVVFQSLFPGVPYDLTMDNSTTFVNFYASNGSYVNWTQTSSNSARIITNPGTNIEADLYSYNQCGQKISNHFYMRMDGMNRMSNNSLSSFDVSPNPASSFVQIGLSKNDDKIKSKIVGFTAIEIYDKMGIIKRQFKYNRGTLSTKIDVSNLVNDTYILRLFNGINWEEHKLLIVR